jgi:flagellar biosynthesis protein FlhG
MMQQQSENASLWTLNEPKLSGGAAASSGSSALIELPTSVLAQRHRGWVLGLPPQCDAPVTSNPLIIAVGGGKGGVGKSLLSANLAARLAKLGLRVAAFDLDTGGANLHTYFGMTSAPANLGDWLVHQRSELTAVLAPSGVDGLSVASAQRDDAWAVSDSLNANGFARLWSGITSLGDQGYQVVLLDLGAGTSRHTIDLFCCAHAGILTALPEPTSVENAYLFMRATLLRVLGHAAVRLGRSDEGAMVLDAMSQDHPGMPGRSYTEKLRLLYQSHPSLIGPMATALSGRFMGILVNQTRSQADVDIGRAMEMAAQRYFGFTSGYLGYLNYDETAWKSLRNKRLLLQDFPHSVIARRLSDACNVLLRHCGIQVSAGPLLGASTQPGL